MVSDAVPTDPDLEPDDTDPIYILLRLIWIVYQVAHRIPGQCTSQPIRKARVLYRWTTILSLEMGGINFPPEAAHLHCPVVAGHGTPTFQ